MKENDSSEAALRKDLKTAKQKIDELTRQLDDMKLEKEKLLSSEVRPVSFPSSCQAIFDSAIDSIFSKNKLLKYIFVNPAMEKLFGLPASELLGKTDIDLFGEEAGKHITDVDMRVLAGETVEEEHSKPVDGIMHTFHVIKVPLKNENNGIEGVCGIARDITHTKLIEESTRKNELQYRNLIENTPDMIYRMSLPDGVYDYISPGCKNVFGYEPDAFYNNPLLIQKVLHPLWKDCFHNQWNDLLSGTIPSCYEYKIIDPQGNSRWIHQRNILIKNEEGLPVAIEGVVSDMTGWKQVQDSLCLTRFAMDNAQASIFWVDSGGNFIDVNNTACRKLGYTREELLERNVADIDPDHPMESRKERWEEYKAMGGKRFQTSHLTKKGKIIPVEVTNYFLEYEGQEIEFAYALDISDLRKADEALAESEEKYRVIVENSLEGIYIAQNGIFVFCNERFAEMFGANDCDEVLGNEVYSFVSDGSIGKVRNEIQQRLSGEKEFSHYHFTAQKLDGTLFEVETLGSSILYKGKPAIQGVVRDVTEQRQLEEQLFQSQKMESIGRLAGGIAHDFNNLLTAIAGYADLLLLSLTENDPIRKEINEIAETTERAANLTRQLLIFSRRQMIKPQKIILNQSLQAMKRMLRRLIGEDINLRFVEEEDSKPIFVDPGQMEQVVVNLAVNARDAMPEGGELTISTGTVSIDDEAESFPDTKSGDYVVLKITDTGIGMDESVLQHIFEPFFTTKPKEKGTGLGLSTVYGIVKQNRGSVYCTSKLAHGTTFTILFPVLTGDVKEETVEENTHPHLKGRESILIAEDDNAVRRLAVRALSRFGYDVQEASSGAEALQMCKEMETPVDLILSDVVMPNMSGTEFIGNVRSIWKDVKVLFMSGYDQDRVARSGALEENDITHYIGKPFRPITLVEEVRKILDK